MGSERVSLLLDLLPRRAISALLCNKRNAMRQQTAPAAECVRLVGPGACFFHLNHRPFVAITIIIIITATTIIIIIGCVSVPAFLFRLRSRVQFVFALVCSARPRAPVRNKCAQGRCARNCCAHSGDAARLRLPIACFGCACLSALALSSSCLLAAAVAAEK